MEHSDLARAGRLLLAGLLAAGPGCVHGLKTLPRDESVHQYVYARSTDEALERATTLLEEQGFVVVRSGNSLGTNFVTNPKGETAGVRVDAEEIDFGHCTVRIERLVLTGAPLRAASDEKNAAAYLEEDRSTLILKNRVAGEIAVTGSLKDQKFTSEQPSTLTEPIKGTSLAFREPGSDLEWELLKRVDASAAKAIELEAGRASGSPVATSVPAKGVLQAAGSCGETIIGLDEIASSHRLVLLGDFPGTNEIPDFVAHLACQAASTGVAVSVGLELVRTDQPALDAFLRSSGTAADQAAFLSASEMFRRDWQDGRSSQATLRLIDRLRALRQAGSQVSAFAFDEKGVAAATRNLAMARAIDDVRRKAPDVLTLVMVGNLRARVEPVKDSPGYPTVGVQLARWGLRPVALRVHFEDGTAWYCPPDPTPVCGVRVVHAPKRAIATDSTLMVDDTPRGNTAPQDLQPVGQAYPGTIRIWDEVPHDGFNGEYFVGPLSASPPPKP
jgi:hypothetical protein